MLIMDNFETYQPDDSILADRVILVTGASQGIGRAMAKSLAAHGATVVLLGKSVKALETLYDEIEQAGFPTPAIYPLNLANATPPDYLALAERIEENFGRLDGLLHNAATFNALTPIEHYSLPIWYQVMQVNLNSVFLLTHALLPSLKKSKDARILLTGISEEQKGKAYWGAYAASKYGCEGFMHVLAEELETNTNIRVNLINPGCVATPLRLKAYPANPEGYKQCRTPESLWPYYVYLLGPDSHSVHGQRIEA